MKMILGPLKHLLNKQETKIEKVHFLKKDNGKMANRKIQTTRNLES